MFSISCIDNCVTFILSSKSPEEEKDQTHLAHSAAEIRDVFGDSDDEEIAEYAVQNEMEQDENVVIKF